MEPIEINPIGYVHHPIDDIDVSRQRAIMVSEIIIDECWADCLTGIEEYSHIFVVFWMHKLGEKFVEQLVHPRGDKNLPVSGVLATRVRNRPNPLGLAVAELLGRDGNCLKVKRLDAFNGTPIIDIKPYDYYDVVDSVNVPDWWAKRCRK